MIVVQFCTNLKINALNWWQNLMFHRTRIRIVVLIVPLKCLGILIVMQQVGYRMFNERLYIKMRYRNLFLIFFNSLFRQVKPFASRDDNVTKFSTCGIDGLIALWDLHVNFYLFLKILFN